MTNPVRPLVRGLVQRLGGAGHGEAAVGDLEEEYSDRKHTYGPGLRLELWYLREAVSLAAGLAAERASEWIGVERANDGRWGMRRTWTERLVGLMDDVRTAVRATRRRPGGSILIILTLAITVGGVSTVAALVHAAWLRPLPWQDDGRLVRVFSGYGAEGGDINRTAVSPEIFRSVVEEAPSLREAGAWTIGETVHLSQVGGASRLIAPRVTSELFPMLGVEAELGRIFREPDQAFGAAPVVVVSRSFWTTALGADPEAIDRTVELDGVAYQVVGVVPDQPPPLDADLWRPLALGPEWFTEDRLGWEMLDVIARLVPGADPSSARAVLHGHLAARAPDRVDRLDQTVVVVPLRDELLGGTGPTVLALLAAAVLVLLVASANIATLLSARFNERARELAMRRSLGAPASALVRLVLAETAVVVSAGGLLGLAAAHLMLVWLVRARPELLGPLLPLGISPPVVLAIVSLIGAVVLLVSLGPALQARRLDTGQLVREGTVKGHAGPRGGATHGVLVVTEIALALTLIVSVGVSLRTVAALTNTDPGFRPDGLVTAELEMPATRSRGEWSALYRGVLERAEALPGVQAAGLTYALPLTGTVWSGSFGIVDPAPDQVDLEPGANMRAVSADYFRAAGIPVRAGRGFNPEDASDLPRAIVDETVAVRFWPGRSPVGERIRLGQLATHDTAVVVGVVADVRDQSLHAPGSGHVYFLLDHSPQRAMTLVLRAPSAPTELATMLRAAVRDVDPGIPLVSVTPAAALVQDALAGPEIGTVVLLGFGSVAALLAALGIFGLVGWTVHRRTPEIGTRIALGASRSDVVSLVLGQTTRIWVAGTALGLVGGVLAERALARVLPGSASPGPGVAAAAALIMGMLAVVAAAVPVRRALSVDVVEALREG